MKTSLFSSTTLLLALLAWSPLCAAPQSATPENPPDEVPAPALESAPAAVVPPPDPSVAESAAVEEAAAAASKAANEAAEEAPLRDLTQEIIPPPAPPAAPPPQVEQDEQPRVRSDSRREIVSFGGAHLPPGESAREVVAIMGNAHAQGPVSGEVIAIMGNSTAEESVGGEVVAIMGNATALKSVGGEVIAIMGDVRIEGHVQGEVVAILGTVHLGPNAVVEGEVVSVGGGVRRAPGAVVNGAINTTPFFDNAPFLSSIGVWFQETILKGRLLAFDARFLWTWVVAFAFLGLYLLIALACGKAVNRCVDVLEQSPGRTILAALLSMIATPALFILLSLTIVGPVLFLLVLMIGMVFAKTAFLAFIGRRLAKPLGLHHAVVAVFFGGLVMMLLYCVPVVAFVLWKGGAALGFGMVVYAIILSAQREKQPRAAGVANLHPGSPMPATAAGNFVVAAPPVPGGAAPGAAAAPVEPNMTVPPFTTVVPPVMPAPAAPPVVAFSALPRAGFWIRLAASILDAILIGALSGMLNIGGYFLFLFTAYCVIMWATKGTTVGGVVCGLKLVRLDERRLDWSVALVRGLAAFLSIAVAGLGFIWVAFDDEKQSWHDKVAGTTIVHVPRGVSLL